MKIIITPTNEEKELVIVDPKTGIEYTADFIGNTGALSDGQFTRGEDGELHCTEETFAWWKKCLEAHQGLEDRLYALRSEHGYDAVEDVLRRAGDADLEDQPAVIHAALNEE